MRRFGAAARAAAAYWWSRNGMDGWMEERLERSSPRRAVPGWGLITLLTSSHRWSAGRPLFPLFCWCDGPAGSMDRARTSGIHRLVGRR
jgi:hypothetical protein